MQASEKKLEKTVVMAFGTFDYFHAGHEDYLKQAKALGDILIVVVARDETVKKTKQRTPIHGERRRLREVAACASVDKATLGYTDDKYKVIKKYRPNVIALGYDQFVFTYGLKNFFIKEGLDTTIVRLHAFKPSTFKSSLIRQSLAENSTSNDDSNHAPWPQAPSPQPVSGS